VVKFFTYLSELRDFEESVMVLESIKEISCPKTELPKKCMVVFMVEYSFSKPTLLKKEGR
jgi:hypothetical protein